MFFFLYVIKDLQYILHLDISIIFLLIFDLKSIERMNRTEQNKTKKDMDSKNIVPVN